MGALDTARRALCRQARQWALAVGVAGLGLLLAAPLALLATAGADWARQEGAPVGAAGAALMLAIVVSSAEEELALQLMHGRQRPWVLARTVAIQAALWAAGAAAAAHLGAERIGAGVIPLGAATQMVSKPLAVFARVSQRCDARLRRTAFEAKAGVIRLFTIGVGLLVVLYVYMTVFTEVDLTREVLVMGVVMPLLQAACMTVLARLMSRKERTMKRAAEQRRASAVAPASPASPASSAATAPAAATAARDDTATMDLLSVVLAKLCFSTGAFATLAIVGSDQTFYLSLLSMFIIEIAQAVLHVKTRGVLARAAATRSGKSLDSLLDSDLRILRWLLYKDLGEKLGAVLALGTLALQKAADSEVAALQASSTRRLAGRGAAIVLLELLSDLGKDVVVQCMGVLCEEPGACRVVMPPLGVGMVVLMSASACLLVQTGLALGLE